MNRLRQNMFTVNFTSLCRRKLIHITDNTIIVHTTFNIIINRTVSEVEVNHLSVLLVCYNFIITLIKLELCLLVIATRINFEAK